MNRNSFVAESLILSSAYLYQFSLVFCLIFFLIGLFVGLFSFLNQKAEIKDSRHHVVTMISTAIDVLTASFRISNDNNNTHH